MATVHITKDNFDETVKSGVVLVDFWAEWCGPCKMAGPVLDAMAEEFAGKLKIGKLDVDAEPTLAEKYGVMSIPTVVLFKDGKEVGRQVGFAGKAGYVQLVGKATLA